MQVEGLLCLFGESFDALFEKHFCVVGRITASGNASIHARISRRSVLMSLRQPPVDGGAVVRCRADLDPAFCTVQADRAAIDRWRAASGDFADIHTLEPLCLGIQRITRGREHGAS